MGKKVALLLGGIFFLALVIGGVFFFTASPDRERFERPERPEREDLSFEKEQVQDENEEDTVPETQEETEEEDSEREREISPGGRTPELLLDVGDVVPDLLYEALSDDVTTVAFPSVTDCTGVSSSPIIVGDYLLFPWHDRGLGDCQETRDDYSGYLFGYHLEEEQMYTLAQIPPSEGSATYVSEEGAVYVPSMEGGGYRKLDADSFAFLDFSDAVEGIVDTSVLYYKDTLYLFTVNSPEQSCQPFDEDCGVFFALDSEAGDEIDRLDYEQGGYHAWAAASPTTDGRYIFAGTGEAVLDYEQRDDLYGCSVLLIDFNMNILQARDEGEIGCHEVSNLKDGIVGEIALSPDAAWAQYLGPSDDSEMINLIQYDHELTEICRAQFHGSSTLTSASFYQAPTIDKDGNAYVTFTLPKDDGSLGKDGYLFKVSPSCDVTELAVVEGKSTYASPTLADDQYVLLVTEGELFIYTLEGELYKTYTLGGDVRVAATPVIHNGIIYVLDSHGTLTVIKDSGLQGYWNAYWPRFRQDNSGSAMLLS